MQQGCLLKILWITSLAKTQNISPTKRISEIKNNMKKKRSKTENTNLSRIRENMCKDQITANDILQQPGCNNCLNIIPIEEFNYNLNKQQFLDAVWLRYQLPLPNLPTRSPCGEKFHTQHSIHNSATTSYR